VRPMARIAHGALSLASPAVAWATREAAATRPDQVEHDESDRDTTPDDDAVDSWFASAARGVDVTGWFSSFVDDLGERPTPAASEVVPALARDEEHEEYTDPQLSDELIHDLRARGLL
jgi:hypothetical protein